MSASIDPGFVRVQLAAAGGRISAVSVVSERPVVAQVLLGRPADDAVRLVPLLFALCGKAQGRAADLALAAARGRECTAQLDPAIRAEAMREHLWRWLLDLPPLLDETPLHAEFVTAFGCIIAGQHAELAALLDDPRIKALRRRLAEVEDVADAALRCLPSLDAQSSLALWPRFDAGFCRAPHWQGQAAETGALARRQGRAPTSDSAFASRWLARLEELRDWAAGIEKVGAGGTASAVQAAPGRGRALVETARGLLMHEIVLDGECIADYFIVAPTEWNFHPQGPLAGWLIGRDACNRAELQTFSARAVAALDPCVRWELEWL
ncbi:MAG: nickel-dependent hydrogenase large subunit [Betaproteobacteria bacterium]|nr:nickel-dependent hydrogenase large subunit [Betaproteobacteria bacterium]